MLSKFSFTRLGVAGVAFGVLFSALGTANAAVIVKEKETFYNVSGKTGEEIFKSIQKNGPRIGGSSLTGGAGHAIATAEFDIEFKNIKKEVIQNRCRVTNVDLVLNVKYTYPRWKGSKGASRNVRQAWKSFSKTVEWHENQHTRIAKEYAEDYEKIIRKTRFKKSTNCDELSIASAFRLQRAALRTNRKQRSFDRKDLRRGGRGFNAQRELWRAK